nr:MAG TPA: hypothetical protein [Caudoviricetes sp.]
MQEDRFVPVKHDKQEQGDNRKDIHTDMRDAKKKVRKQTLGKPKEDLSKPVKVKPKPEPKREGRWVRLDKRTLIFVKEGQNVDDVLEKYRNACHESHCARYEDLF